MKNDTVKTEQLIQLRALNSLREQEALTQVRIQQQHVNELTRKRVEIQNCIRQFELLLSRQHQKRMQATVLTVSQLQDDNQARDIIRRDLRREELYLETANTDLEDATALLVKERQIWQRLRLRAAALENMSHAQQQLMDNEIENTIQDEFDDRVVRTHG